jgi:ubiquinone/menaquinone biosynthesis C-methylase UbiE
VEGYVGLNGKKVLEIGSGIGATIVVWSKEFGANMYGVEPCGIGFDSSLKNSYHVLGANGVSTNRIFAAQGEYLPFADESFDIVYSLNVLEHTEDPVLTLGEAFRVLKPGGLIYISFPNYRSFYEGHYAIFNPPIYNRSFLPWYIKHICKRDPSFAWSLRSELNVNWIRKNLKKLEQIYRFELLSLGKELFSQRMGKVNIEGWAGMGKVLSLVKLSARLKLNALAAQMMLLMKAWTPIVLVVRKK